MGEIKMKKGLKRDRPGIMSIGSVYFEIDTGMIYYYTESGVEIMNDPGTGFAVYSNSEYTSSSPLVISPVDEFVEIPMDVIDDETELPFGVSTFIKNGGIFPELPGDGYSFSLGFSGSSTSNNGSATFAIDIGPTFDPLFPGNFRFPRGSGVDHPFYITSQGYSRETFIGNTGKIVIRSDVATSSLYDFKLQVHRTHKSKRK